MNYRRVFALALSSSLVAMTSACENARTRAHDHAAVFAKLSADDRRLVLRSEVREGMGTDAVYIAWGEPDEKRATGIGKDGAEHWRYHRQVTVTAPLGSIDQLAYGHSVLGMTVPLTANAGFGFGGIGNEGGLLYQPHLQIADATTKEADFHSGKLERFRVYQGEFTLPR